MDSSISEILRKAGLTRPGNDIIGCVVRSCRFGELDVYQGIRNSTKLITIADYGQAKFTATQHSVWSLRGSPFQENFARVVEDLASTGDVPFIVSCLLTSLDTHSRKSGTAMSLRAKIVALLRAIALKEDLPNTAPETLSSDAWVQYALGPQSRDNIGQNEEWGSLAKLSYEALPEILNTDSNEVAAQKAQRIKMITHAKETVLNRMTDDDNEAMGVHVDYYSAVGMRQLRADGESRQKSWTLLLHCLTQLSLQHTTCSLSSFSDPVSFMKKWKDVRQKPGEGALSYLGREADCFESLRTCLANHQLEPLPAWYRILKISDGFCGGLRELMDRDFIREDRRLPTVDVPNILKKAVELESQYPREASRVDPDFPYGDNGGDRQPEKKPGPGKQRTPDKQQNSAGSWKTNSSNPTRRSGMTNSGSNKWCDKCWRYTNHSTEEHKPRGERNNSQQGGAQWSQARPQQQLGQAPTQLKSTNQSQPQQPQQSFPQSVTVGSSGPSTKTVSYKYVGKPAASYVVSVQNSEVLPALVTPLLTCPVNRLLNGPSGALAFDTGAELTLFNRNLLNEAELSLAGPAETPVLVAGIGGARATCGEIASIPLSLETDQGTHEFNLIGYIVDGLADDVFCLVGLASQRRMGVRIDTRAAVVDTDFGRIPLIPRPAAKCDAYTVTSSPQTDDPDPLKYFRSMPEDKLKAHMQELAAGYTMPPLDFSLKEGSPPPLHTIKRYTVPAGLVEGLNRAVEKAIAEETLEEIPVASIEGDAWVSPAFVKDKGKLSEDGIALIRILADLRGLNFAVEDPTKAEYETDAASLIASDIPFTNPEQPNALCFSVIDVPDAYHKVPLTGRASKLLTILLNGKYYRYRRAAQGFSLSGQHFCRALECAFRRVFGGTYRSWLKAYVDDILIWGMGVEETTFRMRLVVFFLEAHGFGAKITSPPGPTAECVGLYLTPHGYRLSDQSIDQLRRALTTIPKNQTALRSLIGSIQYGASAFRPEKMSTIAGCISTLTSALEPSPAPKTKRLSWTPQLQTAVDTLSSLLTTDTLAFHRLEDDSMNFIVLTDASDLGCGGTLYTTQLPLSHITADSLRSTPPQAHLLATFHKSWNSLEKSRHTYELESQALYEACRRWMRLFIAATHRTRTTPNTTPRILILTDSTVALSRWKRFTIGQDPLASTKARRFLGWLEELSCLQHLPITMRHLDGESNCLADAISRFHSQLVAQRNPPSALCATALAAQTPPASGPPDTDEPMVPHPVHHLELPDEESHLVIQTAQLTDSTTIYQGVSLQDISRVVLGIDTDTVSPCAGAKVTKWMQGGRFQEIRHPQGGGSLVYARSNTVGAMENILKRTIEIYVCLIPCDCKVSTNALRDLYEDEGGPDLRNELLVRFHDLSGHCGVLQSHQALRNVCWWPSCRSDMERHVSKCPVPPCVEKRKHQACPGRLPVYIRRFYAVGIDHKILPLDVARRDRVSYTAVLTVTDWATGFTIFQPVRSTGASETAVRLYTRWISLFGAPVIMTSDGGPAFISDTFQALAEAWGVKRRVTAAYNPRANGATERRHRDLGDVLSLGAYTKDLSSDTDIELHCAAAEAKINHRRRGLGGFSPFELVTGEAARQLTDCDLAPLIQGPVVELAGEVSAHSAKALCESVRQSTAMALLSSAEERADRQQYNFDARIASLPIHPALDVEPGTQVALEGAGVGVIDKVGNSTVTIDGKTQLKQDVRLAQPYRAQARPGARLDGSADLLDPGSWVLYVDPDHPRGDRCMWGRILGADPVNVSVHVHEDAPGGTRRGPPSLSPLWRKGDNTLRARRRPRDAGPFIETVKPGSIIASCSPDAKMRELGELMLAVGVGRQQ